jgi:hypothetical protein
VQKADETETVMVLGYGTCGKSMLVSKPTPLTKAGLVCSMSFHVYQVLEYVGSYGLGGWNP